MDAGARRRGVIYRDSSATPALNMAIGACKLVDKAGAVLSTAHGYNATMTCNVVCGHRLPTQPACHAGVNTVLQQLACNVNPAAPAARASPAPSARWRSASAAATAAAGAGSTGGAPAPAPAPGAAAATAPAAAAAAAAGAPATTRARWGGPCAPCKALHSHNNTGGTAVSILHSISQATGLQNRSLHSMMAISSSAATGLLPSFVLQGEGCLVQPLPCANSPSSLLDEQGKCMYTSCTPHPWWCLAPAPGGAPCCRPPGW